MLSIFISLLLGGGVLLWTTGGWPAGGPSTLKETPPLPDCKECAEEPRPAPKPLFETALNYQFSVPDVLAETASMRQSSSPYFWLNSGGELILRDGIGMTRMGVTPPGDRWHRLYARSSPVDTKDGTQPQNLFRLITKGEWKNAETAIAVQFKAINLTQSPNQGEWNGVFLMSRYQDGDHLYYAGVRVDGTAVIKKKYHGKYLTLAQVSIPFAAENESWRASLPLDRWFSMKSSVRTEMDGSVRISLSLSEDMGTEWREIASAVDPSPGILDDEGHMGIRTDFADVWFDDYRITPLQ